MMNQANAVQQEGAEVRVLRPRALSFGKAFVWLALGLFSYEILLVVLALYYFGSLPPDWPEKLPWMFVLMNLGALVISQLLVLVRRRDRLWHWEYDHLGVKVYLRGLLQDHIKWSQISKIVYGKKSGTISLKLERWWQVFGMNNLSKAEYLAMRETWEKIRDEK